MVFRVRVSAACIAVFALGIACADRATQSAWSYDEHVGVVVAVAGTSCFMAKVQSLAPKTTVRVVDPASQQQRQALVLTAADACLAPGDPTSGLTGYMIRFDNPLPRTPFFGIGLVGVSPHFRTVDGSVVADVDGDQHQEFFRSCTSTEGVHFTIWSDSPLTGRRRWHQYHALGYDVSPTCTPGEIAGS